MITTKNMTLCRDCDEKYCLYQKSRHLLRQSVVIMGFK